ncbi:MAG: hypothetical protein ACE5FE_04790 [Acidiferrobacterales bacterium]
MHGCTIGLLVGALIFVVNTSLVQANGLLVHDCLVLVQKMEKQAGVDRKKLAKAKQGCEKAQKLHKAGKQHAAVIKVGQAITLAGKAGKGSVTTEVSSDNGSGGMGNGGGY